MKSTTEPQASSGVDTPKELSDPVPPYPSSEVTSPNFNYPSFSKLLEGVVLAANSASSHQANPLVAEYSRLEGQFKMSHREALACVTAKATEAQVQTQIHLPTKAANSSDASPSTKPELSVPTPSTIEHRQYPSFPNNKVNNTCHEDKKNSQQQSLLHPEDKANDNKRSSSSHVGKPTSDVVKAPNSDGYSWRKYGQKQVKSPESSRSYYRCTYAGCSVKKKVQHCDQSGHIIKVDYKGHHNHDPPSQMPRINKGNSFKKQAMAVESGVKINADTSSQQKLGDIDKPSNDEECDAKMSLNSGSKSTILYNSIESKGGDVEEEHQKTAAQNLRCEAKQLVSVTGDESSSLNDSNDQFMSDGAKERDAVSGQKGLVRPEAKQLVLFTGDESSRLNDSDVIMSDGAKERDVVPGQKRMKERSKECTETPQRAPKQPKIIVHAAGDVGAISDGYRWRKYGQKMVKGNPHPRSYYRCTSAGCPVRKHVERAMDSTTAVIATYEGKHDHDMPVPKKRSPSSLSSKTTTTASSLILAAKATNNIPLHQNEPTQPSSAPSTRRQVDGSGDNTSGENAELGAEKKMLESAQTLLSMGIELKSC